MKFSIFPFILLFTFNFLVAQELNLPSKSPRASISFAVGYTNIEVDYSSPAKRNREIWGNLVPYGELWRAGANAATTIRFNTEINIEGNLIEPGKYAFFLIPKKGDQWTAVLNSDHNQWGTSKYDKQKEIARFDVPAKFVNNSKERLTYEIIDQNVEQGYIKMSWDQARVYIRFLVPVVEKAMEQVDAALESANSDQKWMILARGADFLFQTGKQIDQAMDWADQSSDLKKHSYNWWVKAQVLGKKELFLDAIESGKKAIEYGKGNSADTFFKANQGQIKKQMEEWIQVVNTSR